MLRALMGKGRRPGGTVGRVSALLLATVAALAVTGCGGEKGGYLDSVEPLDAWVGKVDGTRAYIAIISDGEEAAGFVTDGKAISTWFAVSRLEDGRMTIAGRDGVHIGEAEIDGDEATGEIRLGSDVAEFEADRAEGEAGLYAAAEARGPDTFQAGWIVLPDGSVRAALDKNIDGRFSSRPAPKLTATVQIPGFGPQVPREYTSIYFDTLPTATD